MTRSDSTVLITQLDQVMTRSDSKKDLMTPLGKGLWLWLDKYD